MENCIFCKIIAGDIPCQKIYEDDLVIAFLDHRPVRKGHTMVIPKIHVDHFIDLDDTLAQHICLIGQKIGRRINDLLQPKRLGFVVSGFGVPHAHYHIIPMWDEHDITSSRYATLKDDKITFTMDHVPIANNAEQEELVKALGLIA